MGNGWVSFFLQIPVCLVCYAHVFNAYSERKFNSHDSRFQAYHTPAHVDIQMYKELQAALQAAGQDDSVVCAVLTGAGDYYCSGNDLSNFTQIPPEGPQKMAAEAKEILRWG